ncbi:MAG: ATP-binding protein [Thermodesulfobacteriota bacterium]
MKHLAELILSREDWLIDRVFRYAKERDYAKHSSTLTEAWRASVSGLSSALVSALEGHPAPSELGPDDDFAGDPIASFGILEAQRYRSRGVTFAVFMGLMKLYRQSYKDMVRQAAWSRSQENRFLLFIDRFFDRLELGLGTEWVAHSRDELVEELQVANRATTNEKNKYLTMLESLASPCMMLDAHHEVETLNRAALQLLAAAPVQRGHCVGNSCGPELRLWLDAELAEFAHGRQSETVFEKELKTGDKDRVFEVRFKRILDASGQSSGTAVILNDVTERTRAEDLLEENLRFLQTLLDSIPNPVFFKDIQGRYLGCNKAFSDFLGLSKDAIVGKMPHDIAPKDLADRYHSQDLDLFAKGGTQIYEASVKRADGSSRSVVFYKSVFHGSDGLMAGLIGVILDVTEMKQAEQEKEILRKQLFQAQKMEAIGTLTEGIAHDFNNLLTIILGFGELLLLEHQEGERAYQDLQKINETARSGAHLVQRLLAFSRRTEMQPRPLDLSRHVAQLEPLLARTTVKTVRLEIRPATDPPLIDADPAQIDQIVLNLAINASEAMPCGGTLSIGTGVEQLCNPGSGNGEAHRCGTYVVLTVADTGCGMSPHILDRIFDPFFTTKNRDTKKGTGLGLSVVRGIVEQHGGFIRCESRPGIGTTFRVYFPASATNTRLVTPRGNLRLVPEKGTVLLVDDEEPVRDLGSRILSKAGFHVLTAGSGSEALEIYRRNRSDIEVVILDMIMPEMGGQQCLERLVELNPGIRVVVTSGNTDAGRESFRGNLAGFVSKPFRIDELLDQVLQATA